MTDTTPPSSVIPRWLADDVADVSFWAGYMLGQLEADSTVVRFGSTGRPADVERG